MNIFKNITSITILLACVNFTGCKTTLSEKSIIGEFISKSPYSKIIIKSNGEFYYSSTQGLLKPVSNGEWKIINEDEIVLNSEEKFRSGYIKEIEKTKTNFNETIISVVDGNNNVLENGILYINDKSDEEFKLDDKGQVQIKSKVISISVLTLSGFYTLKLDSEGFYNITLKVRHEELNDVFFENKVLRIKRNFLITDESRKYKKNN